MTITDTLLSQCYIQPLHRSKETGTAPLSYMGHLTLLTKSVVQVFQKEPGLRRTLQDGSGGDNATISWQEWDTYANFTMDSCANLEIPLAGIPIPSPTICPSPTSSFPLPPPPIHIPSLPLSIPHSSMPSPSLSPLPSLLLTEVNWTVTLRNVNVTHLGFIHSSLSMPVDVLYHSLDSPHSFAPSSFWLSSCMLCP